MSDLCVVTGASRGIGLATARAYARRGLAVAMLGRRSEALERAAASIAETGARVRSFACDVGSPEEIARASREVLDALGTPRVVVNNAGIVHRGAHVVDTTLASWDEVMSVNLRGAFLVSKAFLPAMLAAKRGRFVHVASISATLGSPGAASYAASKWGLVGLAKSLAEELRGTGLQSIAILPGSVDTEMLAGSGFEPKMTAEDIAGAALYLGLDAPDAMNGSAVEAFG